MKYGGALPSQDIVPIIESGQYIKNATTDNVRPASLDLRLTDEVYRVSGSFQPLRDETVYCAIKRTCGTKVEGEKKILEKGTCYMIKLEEEVIRLPHNVYAYANPKSSSGRVDVHVRLVVDRLPRYDKIERDYVGPLWLLVVPKTFPIIVTHGLSLNQLRLFNQDTRFDELDLDIFFTSTGGLLFTPEGRMISYTEPRYSDRDGSILLSLGLHFDQPGFEAIEGGEPIDLSQKNYHDPRHFFREITVNKDSVGLRAGTFYILSTEESVRVPKEFACEMRPMDERAGDLRSHYAGFIDPGWGVGAGHGRPLTLEVRSFDNNITIRHGQPIAKIRYERMFSTPLKHYDEMSPTYGSQSGPQLAKYFKEWK